MLRRLWGPTDNDFLLFRLAGLLVLPAVLLLLLPIDFLLPDSLASRISLGVFVMVVLVRGVILVRGAYTLPVGEADIDKYKAMSERSRQTFRVAGFVLPLASTAILLFKPELFLVSFGTSAFLSIVFLSISLVATAVFTLVVVVLSAISFTVVAIQDSMGSALVTLILVGVIVPQAFSTFVKTRRASEKVH